MKTNDFIKYLTQEFVIYTNQPREERKKQRLERQEQPKNYSTKWFGLVPFALRMAFKKHKE
ncbi:MAG: YqzE family protein [Bacillus sp. (in: firmicutes)]